MVIAGAAGELIVSDNDEEVAVLPSESVTFTVKVAVPAPVGVPNKTPVEELKVIPVGKVPVAIE